MWKYGRKLYPLAFGGVTLGIIQSLDAIDFNSILFQIVYVFMNTLISLLLGGGTDTTSGSSGLSSLLSNLFA